MDVSGIAGPALLLPEPTREQMIAIAAARPAVLQQQAVALAAVGRGSSGQGTPAIDGAAALDISA